MNAKGEVVQKAGAGTEHAASTTNTAKHIGVDKVRRHFAKAQWALLRGHPLALMGVFQHATKAIVVQLAHGARGVHGYLLGCYGGGNFMPRYAGHAEAVRGTKNTHLQGARVVARGVPTGRIKATGQLSSGPHGSLLTGRQQYVASGDGQLTATSVQRLNLPAGGQRRG